MTPKNIAIEPDILERAEQVAEEEGKTVDELVNDATKRWLAIRRLHTLQRYGQRRADELGIIEDDIPDLIAESRAERLR